jgi:hypothetical protein
MKKKVTRYVTKEEAKALHISLTAERCIDIRTGEIISKLEAIKREAAYEATRNLESEVTELRAAVATLTADLRRVWRQSSRIETVDHHAREANP